MVLNLNPVMSIVANVPAAAISTVRLTIPIENKNHLLIPFFNLDRGFPRCPPFGKLFTDRRGAFLVSCI